MSQNAVTHAINSPNPVAGGESEEDWDRFHQGYLATFEPVGAPEEELVGAMAINRWRTRRVIRAEKADLDALFDAIDDPASYPAPCEGVLPKESESSWKALQGGVKVLSALRTPDCRADLVDPEWDNAIDVVDARGAPVVLERPTPGTWTPAVFIEFLTKVAQSFEDTYSNLVADTLEPAREYRRKIDERAQSDLAGHIRREADRRSLRKHLQRVAILPTPQMQDRLQRAEAHLDRQFARLLEQLELLQRARTNQDMSPPVRVQVTGK